MNYKVRPDLNLNENLVEDIWVKIIPNDCNKPYIVGGIYFHTHSFISNFQIKVEHTIEKINVEGLKYFIMGDFNINLLSDPPLITYYKESLESLGVISLINCLQDL